MDVEWYASVGLQGVDNRNPLNPSNPPVFSSGAFPIVGANPSIAQSNWWAGSLKNE